jgi:glyoxylase-like metal-dependent hydrolase (beta-lactamase superfamily II)
LCLENHHAHPQPLRTRPFTLTYVVFDPRSRDAVVIDPVLDFDPLSAQTSLASVEKGAAFRDEQQLKLRHVLETTPTPTT